MATRSCGGPSPRATTLGLLLAALTIGGTAAARDGASKVAPADPVAARARALYQSGTAHYNLSEFKEALVDYKEGYRLKSDPAFLFNIGQCYRQMGEPEDAAKSYRAYLRASPEARNRAEVEQFIADADAAALAKAKAASRPPQDPQAPQTVPAGALGATPPPESAPPKKTRTWVWVVVGVAAAAVAGTAIGLGVGLSQSGSEPPGSTLGNVGGLQ